MRLKLFYFTLILLTYSCDDGPAELPEPQETEQSVWLIPVCCVIAGLISGILLSKSGILSSKRKRTRREDQVHKGREDNKNAEVRLYELENELGKTQYQVEILKRQLAEAEKLARTQTYVSENTDGLQDTGQNTAASGQQAVKEKLYFLQPTTDGWFKETGQVNGPSDALYELSCKEGRHQEASVQFIDHPVNTAMAIQNESTWILVACERSNIVSAGTTSIRTDVPGKALFKNGAWQITEKARITYC